MRWLTVLPDLSSWCNVLGFWRATSCLVPSLHYHPIPLTPHFVRYAREHGLYVAEASERRWISAATIPLVEDALTKLCAVEGLELTLVNTASCYYRPIDNERYSLIMSLYNNHNMTTWRPSAEQEMDIVKTLKRELGLPDDVPAMWFYDAEYYGSG